MTTDNIVMWERRLSIVDWVNSKTQILLAILRTRNQLRAEGTFYIFGSRTFVPISWMCKKQTSVSHSSVESDITSLDAGIKMDRLPALDFGCGERSVTFIEEYRITNPSNSRKLLAKSKTEMLINCHMRTTSPQTHILLKASLSCTYLKITKQ